MTDREAEAPERIEAPDCIWVRFSDDGIFMREWRRESFNDAEVRYVRADRLAAMEPDPNARALYVRTDIDTAEEIARLREALVEADEVLAESDQDPLRDPAIQDVVDQIGQRVGYGALMSAAAYGWRSSLDENHRGGEFAIGPCRSVLSKLRRTIRAALTDTASAGDAKYNPAAEIIPNGAETTKSDAGDVRRRALEDMLPQIYGMARQGCEAPNAAYRWCERIDEVIHAGQPLDEYAEWARPLPAFLATSATPTVEAAKRVIPTDAEVADVCMSMRHDFGLLGEVDKTVLRREALDWLFAWRRALSQQEGGE